MIVYSFVETFPALSVVVTVTFVPLVLSFIPVTSVTVLKWPDNASVPSIADNVTFVLKPEYN